MTAALHARVHDELRGIDATFDLEEGRILALVGPNGAGKTTILHTLAGVLHPDEAHIVLGGRTLVDGRGALPPWERRVGLLGQRALLFGHLRVRDNVAYGMRAHGVGRAQARDRADGWLAAMGIEDLARRWPRELSGGQAHRVALARTLATEPELLLLDEPLASLDVDTAMAVRDLLRSELARRTVVLVTHDVADVEALADDLLVMEGGSVAERGPAAELLAHPASAFLASLVGSGQAGGGVRRS